MDRFDNIEIIEEIEKAVALLKTHKLLFTNHLNNKTYFVEKKQKVLVIGINSKYTLTYEEFISLYKDAKFVIYEENEESFDFSRDDEYYSWKHK